MESKKPKGYAPPNTILNVENHSMPSPKVEYEERKKYLDINAVKDITKGQYGKKED